MPYLQPQQGWGKTQGTLQCHTNTTATFQVTKAHLVVQVALSVYVKLKSPQTHLNKFPYFLISFKIKIISMTSLNIVL